MYHPIRCATFTELTLYFYGTKTVKTVQIINASVIMLVDERFNVNDIKFFNVELTGKSNSLYDRYTFGSIHYDT